VMLVDAAAALLVLVRLVGFPGTPDLLFKLCIEIWIDCQSLKLRDRVVTVLSDATDFGKKSDERRPKGGAVIIRNGFLQHCRDDAHDGACGQPRGTLMDDCGPEVLDRRLLRVRVGSEERMQVGGRIQGSAIRMEEAGPLAFIDERRRLHRGRLAE